MIQFDQKQNKFSAVSRMVCRAFVILLFCIVVLCLPFITKAAVLSLELKQPEYKVGDIFVVDIKLNSQGEYINAVQCRLEFNQDVLQIEDFSQGNSILTLWIEQPVFSNSNGTIAFIGGIPNGFEGRDSLLGRIIFKAISKGEAEIKFLNSSNVLLNDGLGTSAKLETGKAVLDIKTAGDKPIENEWQREIKNDIISPESFKVYIKRDETFFNNQYFIIFSTVDKQTGIDYYEVKEGGLDWQRAKSPYLLKDQSLKQEIKVKAVDKAGNKRIEIVYPEFYPELPPSKIKMNFIQVGFILVGLVILCYILIKIKIIKKLK